MPTEYDDAFFDVRLCLTSIFWRIYTSNHRWLLGVYYNFKDTIPGCLTDHENKIPVDLQEFPVDILSAYFNTIYTQLMRFFPWHRGENRLNILRCVVSIAANCTAPWNFQQTRQNSSRIPGFPVEKKSSRFPGYPGVLDTLYTVIRLLTRALLLKQDGIPVIWSTVTSLQF